MATIPIPQGATIGFPDQSAPQSQQPQSQQTATQTGTSTGTVPIPQGATVGFPDQTTPTKPPQSGGTTGEKVAAGFGSAAATSLSNLGSIGSHIPFVKTIANKVGDIAGLPKLPANVNPYETVQHSTNQNAAAATQTTAGKAGALAESIAEFFGGDELLKGASLAEKAGLLAKVTKLAESHPLIAKIIGHGLNAVRGGTVVTGQELAHGATPTQALESGAAATGLGTVVGAAVEGAGVAKKALSPWADRIVKGEKVAQPGAQNALRTAADIAPNEPAIPPTVNVPNEYKAAVDEAMKQEPAWTPEKAQPVVKALGDNFELRGSVGEGKPTANDLDIWQKKGKLSDAHDTLKNMGFEYNSDVPHGETWTKGDQNIDLWDKDHEPIKGYGKDTELEAESTEPTKIPELRESLTTPIEAAEKSADALYKTIDDATGNTDIKGLGKQLKDINFKIRMSTNPTDEAAWEAKRANIQDTMADALKQAKDAGVPDDQLAKADAQFKRMSALTDVETKVFKNVNVIDPTTGDVNINAAVKQLQKLQDNTKYGGPRLEQAFGKDNTLLADMKAANRLGIEAFKRQQLAKILGKWAGRVLGLGTTEEVIRHALSH